MEEVFTRKHKTINIVGPDRLSQGRNLSPCLFIWPPHIFPSWWNGWQEFRNTELMFWLQSSLSSILTTITTDNHLLTEEISTEEWISNRKKSQRFEHFDAHIVSPAMWRMRREPGEFSQDLDVWKTSENNTPDPGLVTCSGRWDPTPALTHVVWTRTARGTCLAAHIFWIKCTQKWKYRLSNLCSRLHIVFLRILWLQSLSIWSCSCF